MSGNWFENKNNYVKGQMADNLFPIKKVQNKIIDIHAILYCPNSEPKA